MLTSAVTKNEVFFALQSLPSSKSPGPDSLNAQFSRFYWNDVGDSIYTTIRFFFDNFVMPKSCGRMFISLIPKKPNPKIVSDFRPISLCNVCYKIVSKILPNCLRKVLPNLIGKEQCSFISDRALSTISLLFKKLLILSIEILIPPRMLIKLDNEKSLWLFVLDCNSFHPNQNKIPWYLDLLDLSLF